MTKKIDLKEKGNIQSSFEYVMKFDLPKTAKILDIGCNHGSLIKKLYEKLFKRLFHFSTETIEEDYV